MQRPRIGVVGAGSTGARQAQAIAELPAAAFIGVYDIDLERARALAARYGGLPFDGLEQLLDAVDAVTVATPAATHRAIAEQVLEAGLHLFVAGPLAGSLVDARRVLDDAERMPELVVQVGNVDCLSATFRALQALLEGDRLRGATFRRIVPFDTSSAEIDIVHELVMQDIYLATELFGHDIVKIDAVGASERGRRLDGVFVELLLEDGREVKLIASRVGHAAVTTIEVETERAAFRADLRGGWILARQLGAALDDAVTHTVPNEEPTRAELAHFVACIRRGRRSVVDARAGFNAMVYADAIHQLIARTRACAAGGQLLVAER